MFYSEIRRRCTVFFFAISTYFIITAFMVKRMSGHHHFEEKDSTLVSLLKTQKELLEVYLKQEKQNRIAAEKKIKKLEKDLAKKDMEIRRMKPLLTIRIKIQMYEWLLAPELIDRKSVFNNAVIRSTTQSMDYHEAKWTIILTKVDDPLVIKINGLMANANISPSVFCRTMAGFFLIALRGIHLPPLHSYTKSEMEIILRDEFEIYDATVVSCVTDVLMEI